MKTAARRFVCAAAAAVLLCGGCNIDTDQLGNLTGNENTTTVTVPAEEISLSYNSAYTLDPFADTTALNIQVARIMFEPLFTLDDDLDTYGLLAGGVEAVSDTEYRITLNTGRTFWDSSAVTADDVVFSYQKARTSGRYAHLADTIAELRADGQDCVVALLVKPNRYFMNNLSFPVIKRGNYGAAESGRVGYVGTGLYFHDFDAGELRLYEGHPKAADAKVKTLKLANVPDFEAMSDSISAGIINACFNELPGDRLPQLSGNVFSVKENRLMYIGFNRDGVFSEALLRIAASNALDRSRLAAYYGGYFDVTATPFNTGFMAGASCSNLQKDTEKAVLSLASLEEKPGQITFLVCSDSSIKTGIATEFVRQLNEVGFNVRLKSLAYSAYINEILYGSWDMYLGEMVISDDFSFAQLLDVQTKKYGISCSAELGAARDGFLALGAAEGFLTAYNDELPFIALGYRKALLAYSSNLTVAEVGSFGFAFDGIEACMITKRVKTSDDQ